MHEALRGTLLQRIGYPEGFIGLQQRLLVAIMTHTRFNIADFILCEMEEMITYGMGMVRQFPYGHWVTYILSHMALEGSNL